jgi:hypothetical protein
LDCESEETNDHVPEMGADNANQLTCVSLANTTANENSGARGAVKFSWISSWFIEGLALSLFFSTQSRGLCISFLIKP